MHAPDRIKNTFAAIGLVVLVVGGAYGLRHIVTIVGSVKHSDVPVLTETAATSSASSDEPWVYTFNVPGVLNEAPDPRESSSQYWWLDSGGMFVVENGIGHTIEGALGESDTWYGRYHTNNPLDTDGGRYPQNLFRLVSKEIIGDAALSFRFRIRAIHLTDTQNRDGYSGLFIMSHYEDGDNLYYAGIRQDGDAVIKKKIGGTYYTLAEKPLFPSYRHYDRNTNPNLIPGNVWMHMQVKTELQHDGMHIALLMDTDDSGTFYEVLSAVDTGVGGGILADGRVGIRSDYMDVVFDDFTIEAN